MKKIIEYILAIALIVYLGWPIAIILLFFAAIIFGNADIKTIFTLLLGISTLFLILFFLQKYIERESDKILEKNKQERARRRAEQAEEEAKPLPQWDANENITYHFKKEECGTYAKIRKNRLKKLRPFG
ncbi:hypothetical protein [Ornithobacterium rhinotracheale]|uniref:hypothetical protein n=1 Tax=Ornithobacterium rhinotracheale TaxID=28251 RepID=UPI00129C121A|nr:hypothetical protein [Ornithobacterium rhinotracheale]MRI64195.1 hypothetical protein [Ornithobacterium rhinotracheale]